MQIANVVGSTSQSYVSEHHADETANFSFRHRNFALFKFRGRPVGECTHSPPLELVKLTRTALDTSAPDEAFPNHPNEALPERMLSSVHVFAELANYLPFLALAMPLQVIQEAIATIKKFGHVCLQVSVTDQFPEQSNCEHARLNRCRMP